MENLDFFNMSSTLCYSDYIDEIGQFYINFIDLIEKNINPKILKIDKVCIENPEIGIKAPTVNYAISNKYLQGGMVLRFLDSINFAKTKCKAYVYFVVDREKVSLVMTRDEI